MAPNPSPHRPSRLAPGDRLGRYEIRERIGAGGMGEVYRARDPKLTRDVALKILHAQRAGPEDIARFQREARAAGSLNHPNIVAVHDVGAEQDTPFVVTELLEGETLRARLDRGRLPYRKALDYAIQIAHALDAAHAKGIYHRDVKPANVFLTRDGRIKLLDFGIAKLTERTQRSGPDDSTGELSGAHGVLGSSGYMSPEQILGEPVDHRSDLFALGAVLYEMLTGARAFKGGTHLDTITAVLRSDPIDPATLNAGLPPLVVAILRRCLEKNREERFQTARDLAFDLRQMLDTTAHAAPADSTRPRRAGWLVPAVALALAAAALLIWWPAPPPPPAFEQLTFSRTRISGARFVADGQAVVYSEARTGGTAVPWRIDLSNDSGSQPILSSGSGDVLAARAGQLGLAVDSRFVVGERFASTLAIAPLGGGSPHPVAENIEGADWDPSGAELAIVRSTGDAGGPSRLEYPIGTVLHEAEAALSFPRFSRSRRLIAFVQEQNARARIWVLDLDAPATARPLSSEYSSLRGVAWSATDDEIWFGAGDLRSTRSLRAVDLQGRERIVMDVPGSLTLWDIDTDGRLLISRDDDRRSTLGVPPGETEEQDFSWFDDSGVADVSVDGRTILFGDRFGIFTRPTDGSGDPVHLGLTDAYADALSPDGQFVIATTLDGRLMLVPTGPGQQRALPPGPIVSYRGARWFPGSRRVLFNGTEDDSDLRAYVQDIDGGLPRAITPEKVWALSVSPDGRRVAAMGSGQGITLWNVDGGGPPVPVPESLEGDRPVAWSVDGQSLWVFRRGGVPAPVLQVDIATGRRELWTTLVPPDASGVYAISEFQIAPAELAYFYSYKSRLSELYLVRGPS